MLRYAVVEISGRQYRIEPNKSFKVDFLGEDVEKSIDCDRVLMKSDGDKIEIGTPFLKEKLSFEVLGVKKDPKIRVFKYHSKSNTRKTTGSRRILTELKLAA